MTVAELGARMDSGELNEWMAHFRIMNSKDEKPDVQTFDDQDKHAAALDAALFGRAPKVKA